MARRRWIDPSFWDDLAIAKLKPIERLFFIGCFSNADDEGRLIGNPSYLRATIFKYDDMSLEEVTEIRDGVVAMSSNLILYRASDEEYLAFRTWSKHQKPNYPKESQHPAPPLAKEGRCRSEVGRRSGEDRDEDKGRVGLDRVGKGSGRSDDSEHFSQIFTEVTGVLIATAVQAEEIDAWMEDIPEDWFRGACKEAVDNNVRKWSYIRAILKRWKKEGRAAKSAKDRRRDKQGQDTDSLPYDDFAAAQAARLHEAEAGDGGPGGE